MHVKLKTQTQYLKKHQINNSQPPVELVGGQEFIFTVDYNWFRLLDDEELIESMEHVLLQKSNSAGKYLYKSHEVIIDEPISVENLQETHALIFGDQQ